MEEHTALRRTEERRRFGALQDRHKSQFQHFRHEAHWSVHLRVSCARSSTLLALYHINEELKKTSGTPSIGVRSKFEGDVVHT